MRFTTYTITLAIGEAVRVPGRGRFVRCLSGSAGFKIRLGAGSAPTDFENGLAFHSAEFFESIEVINNDTAGQTIEIVVADGVVDDSRVTISGGIAAAGNGSASYGTVSVGVAATLIKAANTGRSNILVQNLGTVSMFVGPDNAVTAANGIEIVVGGHIVMDIQSAIYAISTVAAEDARYLEAII